MEAPATNAPPASLSGVITRRAIDLVAISLVLIVGLTAGREIVSWWRADSQPPSDFALTDPQAGWSERPLEIQFGDSTSYARVPFRGSSDAAIAELARQLKLRLPSRDRPTGAITTEERDWVTALGELKPSEQTDRGEKIYVVPSVIPTVAATMTFAERGESVTRLAGWGLALPVGEDAFTLLVFAETAGWVESSRPTDLSREIGGPRQASTHPTSKSESESPANVRLPAGATTILGWRDEAGRAVRSFHGSGRIADWLAHFDAEFGPRAASSDPRRARWLHAGRQIDIQFSQNGDEITGVLWMTTVAARQNTSP